MRSNDFCINCRLQEDPSSILYLIHTRNACDISTYDKFYLYVCLQYPGWKIAYADFENVSVPLSMIEYYPTSNLPGDPTAKRAMLKCYYSERIKMVEATAMEADGYLYQYIIKAVTEGLSYTYLKTKLGIPCGKDMYYDRYRRFFWLLNNNREKGVN